MEAECRNIRLANGAKCDGFGTNAVSSVKRLRAETNRGENIFMELVGMSFLVSSVLQRAVHSGSDVGAGRTFSFTDWTDFP